MYQYGFSKNIAIHNCYDPKIIERKTLINIRTWKYMISNFQYLFSKAMMKAYQILIYMYYGSRKNTFEIVVYIVFYICILEKEGLKNTLLTLSQKQSSKKQNDDNCLFTDGLGATG